MYTLPNLPYNYQDLEPYIDTHTLGLHYNIHTNNYLTKLNSLLKENNYHFRYNLNELIYHLNEFNPSIQEEILYNLGGVLNHILYFSSMAPPKERRLPFGNLELAINKTFGSFDNFYQSFKEKALSIKGSGYTFLVINNNGNLEIINLPNQQTPLFLGFVPLFTIDMWEHAYYLNYKQDKNKYLDNYKIIADFTNASNIYNNLLR